MEDDLFEAERQSDAEIRREEFLRRSRERSEQSRASEAPPVSDTLRDIDQQMYGDTTPQPEQRTRLQEFQRTSLRVGADVGTGLRELPVQIAGGLTDAARELLEFAGEADQWVASQTGYWPALNLKDPGERGLIVNMADPDIAERPGLEEVVPEIRGPESMTGGFVRGASQFAAPYGAATKLTKGWKVVSTQGRIVKAATLGATVDFMAFDPYEARLADLLKDMPTGAGRPFFEWLATEDSALEGRAKNAIEGLGLGIAADTIMALGGAYIRARKARVAARRAADDVSLKEPVEGQAEAATATRMEEGLADRLDELAGAEGAPTEAIQQASDFVRAYDEGRLEEEQPVVPPTEATAPEAAPAPATASPAQELLDNFLDSAAFNPALDRIAESATAKQLKSIYRQLFGSAPKGRTKRQVADEIDRRRRREVDVLDRDDEGRAELAARTLFDDPDAPPMPEAQPTRAQEAEAKPEPEPEPEQQRPDLEEEIDGLSGPRVEPQEGVDPADVLRPRTEAEKAVDEIEALPAMEARARAEALTNQKATSKARAIELVRDYYSGAEKPYINTRMINGEQDLEEAVRNLADKFKDDAEIGIRTSQGVIADAEDIKNFDYFLKEGKRPEALTDAEQYALRELWASSARHVRNLAEQAAESLDPAVQFAFRRAVTMHRSIQEYAFKARAGAARNLRQWAIPVGENAQILRSMEDTLESLGGIQTSQALAKKINEAAKSGNLKGVENAVSRGWLSKSIDMINEFGVSAKLYQPSTHLVNMGGNALMMGWEILNRQVAEGVGIISQTGVQRGEAAAMTRGMMLGIRDAFREARQAFRTGSRYIGSGKVELPRQSAFDPATLEMRSGTLAARAMKIFSLGVQLPFRGLNSADVFFKVMNERSELYAQAMRQAVREGGDDLDATRDLFAKYVNEPTREMQEASLKAAAERTFTSPATGFVRSLMNLRAQMPILGYLQFPFIQTPANIIGYAVRSSPAAPLNRQFREEISAGGARRDMAIARVATGSTMLALGMDMTINGEITGGGPPPNHPTRAAWRRQNRPYSIKIGDRTIEYRRLDPFGVWLGTSADIVEMFTLRDIDPFDVAEFDEIFAAVSFSLGHTIMNKTWMTGLSDFMDAQSDPQRYGDQYWQNILTGFIPSGLKTAARVNDPYLRETTNWAQAIQAQIFGFSERFPFKRDWAGRPIDRSSGLGATYDFISPIAVQPDRTEPIDREIMRLGWGPGKPSKTITYKGVAINLKNEGEILSRYYELAGNIGGRSLIEDLNAMIQMPGYQRLTDGPEGQKVRLIRARVEAYRDAARKQLVQEYQAFFEENYNRRIQLREAIAQEQAEEAQSQAGEMPTIR
jgi:hypothetical protein